ncbi:MAG: type II toxin-antitoxin system VapC family toxin [Verrucomicrobiota bacterium]
MAFLLDTNVVSELRRKQRCHPNVAKWQSDVESTGCFISVVTLMEIINGIEATKRRDAKFAVILERWYENQVLPSFSERILAMNSTIAEQAGQIMAIRTRSTADCIIAATALIHELTLVTRNVTDFSDTGVDLVNPWED